MTTRPFLQVADGAAADERLGDRAHLDGGDHAGDDALLLERVLQRQGVDDRGQHAHVVGGRAVHAPGAGGDAAEDVAAADDDGGLDAQALDFGDIVGDLRRHGRIDAEVLLAHQGFAGQLQKDAFVGGSGRGRSRERDYRSRLAPSLLSFADLEPREPRHRHRRPERLGRGGQHISHGHLGIADRWLIGQDDLRSRSSPVCLRRSCRSRCAGFPGALHLRPIDGLFPLEDVAPERRRAPHRTGWLP